MLASIRSTAVVDFGYASSNITITEPEGAVAGDVLVLFLWTGEADGVPTENGGSTWTVLQSRDWNDDPWYFQSAGAVFAIERGASAPNRVFARGGETSISGACVCVQGADFSTIVSNLTQSGSSQVTSLAMASVTVPTGGGLVVLGAYQSEGSGTSAPPVGYTEHHDIVAEAGFNGPAGTSSLAGVSAGSYSPGNYTFSNSAELAGFTVAVGNAAAEEASNIVRMII